MSREFYAFINKREAEKRKIDISRITNPYHIWNSEKLNEISYVIHNPPLTPRETALYEKLAKDPGYKMKRVISGN